jgi:hypothetical protein
MLWTKSSGVPAKLVNWLLVLSIVFALWIVGKRFYAIHIASTVCPGTAITSGCEEESIFALWRTTHGDDAYLPKDSPPYAATYFNWAFYKTYGAFVGPFWKQGKEANAIFWARIFTACIALAGAGLGVYGFRRVLGENSPWALSLSIACFVFTGPLVGWWLVTIRPDVCGLVAETVCIFVFLRYQGSHTRLACAAAVAGSYVAWSFKPTCISGLASICVFLLLRRRWTDVGRILVPTVFIWALTLAVGGANYRNSILDTATNNSFYLTLGLSNLFAALKAGVPLVILAVSALVAAKQLPGTDKHKCLARDAAQLGLIGSMITTSLMLVASSKLGASPNYFFPAIFMISLWAAGTLGRKAWEMPSLVFAAATIILQLGLIFGAWGTLDLRSQSTALAQRWSVFEKQPEPRFSADLRLNLPWLNPASPPLMPAYNYASDRNRGVVFKDGGIGGMIKAGKFNSLLLPTSTNAIFDYASLDNFTRSEVVNDYSVYLFGR